MKLDDKEALANVWAMPELTRGQCQEKAARLLTLSEKCKLAADLMAAKADRFPLRGIDLPPYAQHLAGSK